MNISKDSQEFLENICDNIKYSPIRESVKNELYEHILEGKKNYINMGVNNEEAEKLALEDLGAPNEISNSFNKVYKRKLDWKMLIIFILLTLINILLVTSVASEVGSKQYIYRNIAYIIIGFIISILLYFSNYKKMQKIYIGIWILGVLINISNIYLYNNDKFDVLNNLHINLNLISTFLYIISFSSFMNNLNINDKKNLVICTTFTALSILLIYLSNDSMLLITTLIIYMILSIIKISTLDIKKYKKFVIPIILVILTITILNVAFAKPHLLLRMLNPDLELSYMQDRLNNSKIIGTSDMEKNIDTNYYYMNFSNYSFVYLIEQYGKILGIFIVIVFTLLAIKIIFSYKAVKDGYGKLLIIGLGSFIFIQSILNLFTILGIINIGITNMPFITHDSANIIIYMISIALILSIYGQKNFYEADKLKYNCKQAV